MVSVADFAVIQHKGKEESVDIRHLKQYVLAHLPEGAPLFQILLSEKNELVFNEYMIKVEMWWKLLDKGYDAKSLRNVDSI